MDLLDNPIRPYVWGSPTAIPNLLGMPVTGEPVAEIWVGAHPLAPSVIHGSNRGLDAEIAVDPQHHLGPAVVERFGPRLPFLLKLLGVARPLSLQVHPSADVARAGFAAEERSGLTVDDPKRNYKDPEHKPELVVALQPFAALIGFRPPDQTLTILAALDTAVIGRHLAPLREQPDARGLRAVVAGLLQLAGDERRALVEALDAACQQALAGGTPYDRELQAIRTLAAAYPDDPGVAVALLMRRCALAPGEAAYLPAGTPHAYLSGLAIEVMASSDNVLRGGLTPKHVDVAELLRILDVSADEPQTWRPSAVTGVMTYDPPVDEFTLHIIRSDDQELPVPGSGPRLVLCLEGKVTARSDGGRLWMTRGQAAFVSHGDGRLTLAGRGTVVLVHSRVAGAGELGEDHR